MILAQVELLAIVLFDDEKDDKQSDQTAGETQDSDGAAAAAAFPDDGEAGETDDADKTTDDDLPSRAKIDPVIVGVITKLFRVRRFFKLDKSRQGLLAAEIDTFRAEDFVADLFGDNDIAASVDGVGMGEHRHGESRGDGSHFHHTLEHLNKSFFDNSSREILLFFR